MWSASFRNRKMVRPSSDCLIIKGNLLSFLFSLAFVALGVLALILVAVPVRGEPLPKALLPIAVPSLFILFGLGVLLSEPQFRFDLSMGRLVYGTVLGKRQRSLADIVSIEIAKHRITSRRYTAYRLSLVLQDSSTLVISDHTDFEWTQHVARQLSSLLGCQLTDRVTGEHARSAIQAVNPSFAESYVEHCRQCGSTDIKDGRDSQYLFAASLYATVAIGRLAWSIIHAAPAWDLLTIGSGAFVIGELVRFGIPRLTCRQCGNQMYNIHKMYNIHDF